MSERKLKLGFAGREREVQVDVPAGSPEPWGADAVLSVVGKEHPRPDARDKVTGAAKYTYDIRRPGMIFARLLRSPHAHARVVKVDLERAKALAGVLYTESYQGSEIRFAGQQVAGVAAESEEILDDALALIDVEYEILEHVVTVEGALKENAPKVKGDGNVADGRRNEGTPDNVARAHAEADVVLERIYRTQVQTHSALETHGCVCEWNGEKLTVWASTQGTFSVRGGMAQHFKIPAEDVLVITEHMGGGFGAKFGTDFWDLFCARAARQTKRPCRLMLDRREEHLVAGNRPDSLQHCIFSAMKDGTLMGAEVRVWGTGGVGGGAGVANPAIYRFRATHKEQKDIYTHAGSGRAFRAPGHPQGIFALEGMIDELAEAIGLDPLDVRRKNDPHPVRSAQYDRGAREIGWERRRSKPGSDAGTRKRGLGMASARWGHNMRPNFGVLCRLARDGSVLVANGAQDLGTGTRTVLAVLAAEELGLDPARITVRLGRTDDPEGPGSGGSVTSPTLGPSARDAAFQVKRKLLEAVAAALGGDAAAMELKDGMVVGGLKPLALAQACALLPTETVEALGRWQHGTNTLPNFAGDVAGVQFAEVEVDVETGHVRVLKIVAVQDCGRVINPLLARSQITGGVIQGISYALYENRILDDRIGTMVNANLLDYRIVGALEMPEIVTIPFSVANGINHVGMSSLGEPPTVPTAGAIANAVANALGVRIRSLPITPDKVLAALGGAS
ncbi:MAG: xanthine dehydrogenase family protein molybdopterin-binding subunit [Planctomycetaceae bacterium]